MGLEQSYTVRDLMYLWDFYHDFHHPPSSDVPCDANPGDDCSVDAFLSWLTTNRMRRSGKRKLPPPDKLLGPYVAVKN